LKIINLYIYFPFYC